jgi:hypothetical protein
MALTFADCRAPFICRVLFAGLAVVLSPLPAAAQFSPNADDCSGAAGALSTECQDPKSRFS